MNIIKEIVQYFFVPLLGAIFFMAFVNTNKYFKKKIVQYFIYATIFTVLLAISDSFQGYYESLSYPTKWRMFFASLSYSFKDLCYFLHILIIY